MVENLLLTIKELKIKLNSTANTNKEVLGVIYMEKYVNYQLKSRLHIQTISQLVIIILFNK